MTSLGKERQMHFLVTGEMACPYLPGKKERKLITELPLHRAQAAFELLSEAGFRRTHMMAYRPACRKCDACIPVRVRTTSFKANRTQRRVLSRNQDLDVRWTDAVATQEHYELFSRYLSQRHGDSDMMEMRQVDFIAMIEETPVSTKLLECRHPDGNVCAVCLVDCSYDGYSAVYSFFDPYLARRSLGSFLILSLILSAQHLNLPYVYLGYWVPHSPKMAYKADYSPLEILTPQGWSDVEMKSFTQ